MHQLSKYFIKLLLNLILFFLCFGATQVLAQNKKSSTNVNINNGKTTITIKNGRSNSFSLEFEGDITLSDDDMDITAISGNGFMEIKKSAFGSRRRIFIEPDNSGRLIKKYYVGSSEQPYKPEGEKWLAEILPEVLRSSTIASKQRVDRFYKKGGANAVLHEIGYITSDYIIAHYIKLLLDKNLKNSDLVAVLDVVGEDINSDHHKAEILKYNAKAFLASEATISAYIEAAGEINSDHHTAEVLKSAIRDGNISESQLRALFDIVDDINSDHHKANVLKVVMDKRSLSAENIELLISTSKSINSDHHKADVLKKALALPALSDKAYATLLESIANINSDHHVASVITELLKKKLNKDSLAELLRLAGSSIQSDHHLGSALRKVVQKQELQGENLTVFLNALKHMNSDTHVGGVYKELASKNFSDSELIAIFGSMKGMSSDHHQTEALLVFAPEVKQKGEGVKEAYRNACSGISSEMHYGRAIRAIQ